MLYFIYRPPLSPVSRLRTQTVLNANTIYMLGWLHTCNVTAYRNTYHDSVDGTRNHVTYQKLVTR